MPPILAAVGAYLAKNAVQIAFSLAITLLQKSGLLKSWQADGIRAGQVVLQTINSTKTYSNNDQLNPAKSDFPEQIHHNGV
jgi:hypothetical protein